MTPYLRSEKFRTANVENDSTSLYQHYRWTVDEAADLEFIRAVYKAFRGKENFGMKDVLELIEKNPGLEKMNSDIVSNRGYYKSLFEDAHAAAAPRRPIEKSKAWLERAGKVIPGCCADVQQRSQPARPRRGAGVPGEGQRLPRLGCGRE